MGSSQVREHAPVNVVVECASIVQEALPCVCDMATGRANAKQRVLLERIERQQAMIAHRIKRELWFCLYYNLLELTLRTICNAKVQQSDIQNMFDKFTDHSDECRTQYDLATQILMIVHQLLRFSLEVSAIPVPERWQVHDSIADSVLSADKRFRLLVRSIPRPHRPALKMLFKIFSTLYDSTRRHTQQIDAPKVTADESTAKNDRTRTRTESRRGVISAPVEWSEESGSQH